VSGQLRRIPRGRLEIEVDAPAGRLVRPQPAVLDPQRAGEHLVRRLVVEVTLLDAEGNRTDIERDIRGGPDRRRVARAVPRRTHATQLGQVGELARRGEAADVGDMRADEVDAAVADQAYGVAHGRGQLTDRERHRRGSPHLGQPVPVFRREHVLEEEQPVRLERPREQDRFLRSEPGVDVVQQLDVVR
jgi:hypothetical protein